LALDSHRQETVRRYLGCEITEYETAVRYFGA
jgi:hypothetical protein